MNRVAPFVPFLPWLGGVLGFVCLLFALRSGKRKRLVDNLPTSKTTGVFIGLVELKGTAESARPLTSYLAGQPCVTACRAETGNQQGLISSRRFVIWKAPVWRVDRVRSQSSGQISEWSAAVRSTSRSSWKAEGLGMC